MPQILAEQGSQAWLDARKGRVTASLAACCLGIGYDSPRAAWRQITGREKVTVNDHMQRGLVWEETARNAYARLCGVQVRPGGFWTHPRFAWLGASPDGLCDRISQHGTLRLSPSGLECKIPMTLPTSVPLAHRIQCLIQIAVCELAWVDYFAFCPATRNHYWARIFPCRGTDTLIRRLHEFYEAFVRTDTEPPIKKRGAKSLAIPKALQPTAGERAAAKSAAQWGYV
jgi:YqaJ-like viral recombinase domain